MREIRMYGLTRGTSYRRQRRGVDFCSTTTIKQKSIVSTGLRNECCTGYWMAGYEELRKKLTAIADRL